MTKDISEITKELLVILMEECSEVSKIASKIYRFGPFDYHPDDPEHTPNVCLLEEEIGHVFGMIDLLSQCIPIDHGVVYEASKNKVKKVRKLLELD
jgi:hypothetical protein